MDILGIISRIVLIILWPIYFPLMVVGAIMIILLYVFIAWPMYWIITGKNLDDVKIR